MRHQVEYEPANRARECSAEIQLAGPIWFPVNYLLIEALQKSILLRRKF